jgi:acetolactate synthase small subunit
LLSSRERDRSRERCAARTARAARAARAVGGRFEVVRARVVDMSTTSVILELTGSPDRIAGLAEVLTEFGIEEMVQTGSVAMSRGSSPPMTHLGRQRDADSA